MNTKQAQLSTTLALAAIVALVATLTYCAPVRAQTDIIFGGFSYHDDREANYNEVHHNLGARIDNLSLMYYYNSSRRHTLMMGYDWLPFSIGDIKFGGVAVAGTGYTEGGEPTFGAFLKAQYQAGPVGIDFHWLPTAVAQVQFSYRLQDEYTGWRPSGDSDWAASYGYGLLGGTASAYYRINDHLTARASFTTSKHGWDDRWDHWDDGAWLYQQEHLRPRFYGVNLDYAPIKGDFIVYGGIGVNDTTYSTTYHAYTDKGGDTCGQVNIVHTPAEVCHGDKLYGHVEWGDFTGAAGIRWGNPFTQTGWDWYVDLGIQTVNGISCEAVYDGEGSVTYDQLEAFEDKECAKYDDLVKFVPRAELGFSYRF